MRTKTSHNKNVPNNLNKSISIWRPSVVNRPKTAFIYKNPPKIDQNKNYYSNFQNSQNIQKQVFQTIQKDARMLDTDNDKKYYLYNIFDLIVSQYENVPIFKSIEENLKYAFDADSVYFWIDRPKTKCIYSPTLDITSSYDELPGFIILTNNVIQFSKDSPYPKGYRINKMICDDSSSQLIFPISNSITKFRALIHVVKNSKNKNGFNSFDNSAALFFIEKFKIYSSALFSPFSLDDIALNFFTPSRYGIDPTKLLKNLFNCKVAEVWHFNVARNTCSIFDSEVRNLVQVTANNIGIVKYSISTGKTIYIEDCTQHEFFSNEFDKNCPGSIFVVPFDKGKNDKWAIALRGGEHRFSAIDEYRIHSLLPFIIKAVDGFKESDNSSLIAAQLKDLFNLSIILSDIHNTKELYIESRRLIAHITDCKDVVMYYYDNEKQLLKGKVYVKNDEYTIYDISETKSVCGMICESKKLINFTDVAKKESIFNQDIDKQTSILPLKENDEKEEKEEKLPLKETNVPKSFIGSPIFHSDGENLIGCILIYNRYTKGILTEYDENLLTAICTFIGISYENCVSFENTNLLLHELEAFNNNIRHETFDNDQFNSLLSKFCLIMKWKRISLFLMDKSRNILNLVTNAGKDQNKFGTIFAQKAIEANKKQEFSSDEIIDIVVSNNHSNTQVLKNSSRSLKTKNQKLKISTLLSQRNIAMPPTDISELLICEPLYINDKIVGVLEVKCDTTIKTQGRHLIESLKENIEKNLAYFSYREAKTFGNLIPEIEYFVPENQRSLFRIPELFNSDDFIHKVAFEHDFNPFLYENCQLFNVVFQWFSYFDLLEEFQITCNGLFTFLRKIMEKSNKSNNLFISFPHAVEILQHFGYILKQSIFDAITRPEILAVFIASLFTCLAPIDDNENSSKSQKQKIPISNQFNKYQIALLKGFEILNQCHFYKFEEQERTANERKLAKIISSLLTKLYFSKHEEQFEEIDSILNSGEWDPVDYFDHRLCLIVHIFRCCDVCFLTKSFSNKNDHFSPLIERIKSENYHFNAKLEDERAVHKEIHEMLISIFTALVRCLPAINNELRCVENSISRWKSEKN